SHALRRNGPYVGMIRRHVVEGRAIKPPPVASHLVAGEGEQPVQDAWAADSYTVVFELVGDPAAQAPDGTGGPQGVRGVDVHVVVVDGRRDRDLVDGEARGVVERPPVGAGGQEFGRFAQRTQG